jgi:hypothetical protein
VGGLQRRAGLGALVLAGQLAVAVIVLAASEVTAQTATPLRVSMYGDSVMLGARDQLLAQFAGHDVSVDAVEDRSLLGSIGILRAAGPALGDVVVLDLGYNDGDDPATFRGRIDDAMSALTGVRRVLWLNQREWRAGRAGMNAELVAAVSRYPNLEVLDWNAEVVAHPDAVYGDGIHLTPAGQSAMATLVRRRFDAYVASTAPTTTAPPPPTTATVTPGSRPVAGGATGAADDTGIDDRSLALAVVALTLVVGGAALALGRRTTVRRTPGARRAARATPPER